MKNKVRKSKINDEFNANLLLLPQMFKEKCTNHDILIHVNNFDNSKSIEEQIAVIHSFSSYLNKSWDNDVQFVLKLLTYIFIHSHPKNPVKKSVLRSFANATNFKSQISTELSQQLLEQIKTVSLEANFNGFNDCINSINDCFNNFPAGIIAASFILPDIFQFLIVCLKLLVDNLSNVTSPIALQEFYNFIHNTTRGLVAVSQQCENINTIIPNYMNDIAKYSIIIFNNQDIFFDTKNNYGILLVTAANYSEESGYKSILQISFNELSSKWGISYSDINDDISIICLYSGVLNVVKPEQLCIYEHSFETSYIYKFSEKLFNISKISADKPSVVLGVNRALLLVSRALEPLNDQNLILILNNLLDHIWTQLDHFVDTVRHVSKLILINIVKLTMNRQENGQIESLNVIVDGVLKTSLFKNTRYVALSVIAHEIGCEILFEKEPNLVQQLLELSQETSISSYVTSCYESLMRHHLKEINEENWLNKWVLPLTSKLKEDEELDQKGSFLQHLLIVAIKLRPNILDALLNQWNIENEVQLSSLLKCTLIARKIGVATKENSSQKWRGILDYSILDLAKCHQNDEIRISCLSIIAESQKSTEIFNEWELQFVLSFMYYNMNAQFPSTRQQILFLIKKILTRYAESYYGIIRDFNKFNEKFTAKPDNFQILQQQKKYYKNFMLNLRDLIFDSLFPGANFSRRIICLEVLTFIEPILQEIFKSSEITVANLWKQNQANAVLLCLGDSYESNKQLATRLLEKCPVRLLKLDNIENTKTFINNALDLAISVKPADTATAAYMLETTMYSPILSNVLLDLNVTETQYSKEYLMIKFLFENLKEQIEIGKKSLLKAAASAPMHGTLFCLRHLMEKYLFTSKLNDPYWKILVEEIIKSCFEVSEIAGPVVNNSSPEGHLPMDHETCNEDDDGTITAQMLLVCSWRSIKEVCLLLGEITLKLSIVSETQSGLITEEQILKIGEHFTILLTETKHRGAFEQAYVGFSKLCTRLWKCKSEVLHQLPVMWLNDIIDAISGKNIAQNSKLCATRRSAGVPFMIQAIVASELQTGGSSNFHRCMKTLLQFANHPGDNIETRTHSMNILRALYRHTQLGEDISPYIAEGVTVAVIGFSRNTWAERNSATLLFSSLMTRIFGVQRSRDTDQMSIRNRMTARVFFLRHPTLHPFLLKQLEELTDENCESYKEVALFPILLMLARLYPANNNEFEANNQLQGFIPYVKKCARNKSLKTRELAAKALVPIVPLDQKLILLKDLFSELKNKNDGNNYVHGILLQILHLLRTTNDFVNYFDISFLINETRWIMLYKNPDDCAVNAALYMQMITRILSNYHLVQIDPSLSKKLLNIISNQDKFIQNHCIVGKTIYSRDSICLQLNLLIQQTHINTSSDLCEFVINKFKFGCKEIREFVLNFLIYFLKHPDISVLVDDLEIPEQEKNLVEIIPEDIHQLLKLELKRNIHNLTRQLKWLLVNENLMSKSLFLLSYFKDDVYEQEMEYSLDYFSFYTNTIENGDEEISSASLLCLRMLLKLSSHETKLLKLSKILPIFLEFSSSRHNLSSRYCIALILLDNSSLLFAKDKIDIDHLITLWRIAMQLLADNEPVVRNTICKLLKNSPVAEKSREELLYICVENLKSISKNKCISVLLFWSLVDFEAYDCDEDTDVQIFERGETSTYVEEMCLSKLSSKMLSKLIKCEKYFDFSDNSKIIIDILKTDNKLWDTNTIHKDILISVLEEIQLQNSKQNLICVLQDCFYNANDKHGLFRLDVIDKYKIINIIKSLVPIDVIFDE